MTVACVADDPGPVVERADSAGVDVVVSGAQERLLAVSFIERFALGGEESGPGSFYRLLPEFVATDRAGQIHVLDVTSHRVVTFDDAGRFIRAMGRRGQGPGELERPRTIAVTGSGEVSVFDRGKMALVRWDSVGELLPRMPFPHWRLFDGRHHAVTREGYLVSTRVAPGDWSNRLIAVTGDDTLTLGVTPSYRGSERATRSCGGVIPFPPFFTRGVVWDHRNGTTAVAAGDEYEIDIWRGGRLVQSLRRPIPPLEATRELAIREAGNGYTLPGGACTVPPDDYADAKGWAKTVPTIRRLALGPDGGLYVERWVPGAGSYPIDVFDPDGAYRGTLPEGTSFPALLMVGGRVGLISVDDLDLARLVVGEFVGATVAGHLKR